jgi:hypothetical protein
MNPLLEYHKPMRPSISASVAFFGSLAVALFLALPALGQINGTPASVTSPGFGGNAVNGPRSSVTSVGPQGYAPPFRPPLTSTTGNGVHHGNGDGDGHHHHRQNSDNVGPIWYAVPVPYGVEGAPADDQQEDAADNDADYQGGPTVFDRRGAGERSYVPPVKEPAHVTQRTQQEEAPAVEPDPPLPPTLLIFKDGRTLEVANYAILGPTVFDLTPGHRRKIPVMDLDLEATRKQNDERGVTFQLPQSVRAN